MAQTINQTTSFMTEVFSDMEKIKASKGFLSMFGRAGSKTEFVDNATEIMIDIIRGEKKRLAERFDRWTRLVYPLLLALVLVVSFVL